MTKLPNPIDVHVGGRVRLRRMAAGMSQETLARALGLTFQQVQKYEKGSNRIGASRLYQIAQTLDVPVEFFYAEMPEEMQALAPAVRQLGQVDETKALSLFLRSVEGLTLNSAFQNIDDNDLRRSLVDMIRSIARRDQP